MATVPDESTGTTRRPAAADDAIGVAVDVIRDALATAADEQAWQLSEETLQCRLAEVLAIRASVEELTARLLAAVTDRELPRLSGASSPRAWLMSVHRMSAAEASRLLAGTAGQDPKHDGRSQPTRRAWAAGQVSTEQAVLIANALTRIGDDVPTATTDAIQADLVENAGRLSYAQLQHVCRHAVEVVDPDGADAILEAQLLAEEDLAMQLTQFRSRDGGDGTVRGSFRLPRVTFDMLKAALEATASPRRGSCTPGASPTWPVDQAGCRGEGEPARLGYPQRMGLAFAELIEHLPTDQLPQHGVANATIVVTTTLDQLHAGLGESLLDTGTLISAGQTRRLACNALLVPMVLGGPSRILDLGLGQRLFSRSQRLALAVRDRGCVWPGCERPPSFCEAHHITEWSRGGPSDLANGCLLCAFHHHLVHNGEWCVRMSIDGVPDIIPPTRVDPSHRPLRHQRFKHPARC